MKNTIKKIDQLMSGSYEPSLSDVKRIYGEYSLNKGELSAVLSDVFNWLSQEPLMVQYMQGKLYARAEADKDEILAIHYIYK